jgi:hypothetical protein
VPRTFNLQPQLRLVAVQVFAYSITSPEPGCDTDVGCTCWRHTRPAAVHGTESAFGPSLAIRQAHTPLCPQTGVTFAAQALVDRTQDFQIQDFVHDLLCSDEQMCA